MKSWKTTVCGILAALAGGITLVAIPILDNDPATVANWGAFGAALAAAFGLLFARDNDKSSESVGAK
jgi:hypothetical protein